MPQLDSSSLVVFRNRTHEEIDREPITVVNGREISDHEQELVTQATRDARLREASMLGGLLR